MQTGAGGAYTGGFRNASDAICFDWNASISGFGMGMSSPTITAAFKDDIILGRNGTMPSTSFSDSLTPQTPFTEWAISLKPASRGSILWMRNAYLPADGVSLNQGVVDKYSRVYIWWHKETLKAEAFNLDTGQRVWGPQRFSGAKDYWETDKYSQLAYSNLYYAGYEGIIYCIDMATGKVKWTYGNGGEGNRLLALTQIGVDGQLSLEQLLAEKSTHTALNTLLTLQSTRMDKYDALTLSTVQNYGH
jgi:outer membrane protein assembly factor BamB